ncbi:ribose-5-phosphate isomerase A [Lentibacillus kapialis]|uniref:Ribose-5-phosphate isomerase A n=1 Tax=Lentibacillus kapialis TaxID=340214 RepID=A0A917Q1T7_9BACI|nr:ribose 5-phosphate isomerase A [Lentibacillus kapialis]GGK06346.1 ribose-5-phosphate isomerase A [Lentibacillus kapialis]
MVVNKTKATAAKASLKYINNGMTIGLGSGSTMYYFLEELGNLVQSGLHIEGVPTSKRTEKWALDFGVPLTELARDTVIDVAIDGANQVDENFHLLKGGGGSLVREKIVAASAKELIILIDDSKCVSRIHDADLPVEVLPFGWEKTAMAIEQQGYDPILRYKDGASFISDNGNYIVDCHIRTLEAPLKVHQQFKKLTGVVDTGLFIGMADRVIIGKEDGAVEKRN